MREDLHDYGIIIDTLETSVLWDRLHDLHQGVRQYIKGRPETICMTHASHFYLTGTNLYFIFMGRFENVETYRQFQRGIIDRIQKHGGSLSHHHGIGRMMAPWMARHLGRGTNGGVKGFETTFRSQPYHEPRRPTGVGFAAPG